MSKKEEPTKIEPKKDPKAEGYVTKSDFEKFMERIGQQMEALTKTVTRSKKEYEATGENFYNSDPIDGRELGVTRPIEKVSENDFVKTAELEAFMNQKVLIYVQKSSNKEDNPVIVPNVNGINQPIIRGVDTWVRRCFVEALARNRTTRYEQHVPDESQRDKFVMLQNTSLKDLFIVKKDPHKYGIEWLDAILREEAAA
ncbi:MAG: hypothetical protein H8D87_04815 [Deltaproteobacteria bacterium]|nr:hypothetical protein [Candidatus Desulfobacula maris]